MGNHRSRGAAKLLWPWQRLRSPAFLAAGVLAGWAAIALLFSAQGYAVSYYRGTPQAWWPSFGYSLAISSIWALLTAPMAFAVRRLEAGVPVSGRLLIYAAGLPLFATLHVGLFAMFYWPLYNGEGRIPTRWAMAESMFASKLDVNTIFYLVLLGIVAGYSAFERRVRGAGDGPAARAGLSTQAASLQVREKGVLRLLPLEVIDWIGAAGNYAEVHTGARAHLLEESLSSLAARLPPERFARIHRSAVVALDRIAEVRSLGRGDARVMLADGTELRLSRRYRGNLDMLRRR